MTENTPATTPAADPVVTSEANTRSLESIRAAAQDLQASQFSGDNFDDIEKNLGFDPFVTESSNDAPAEGTTPPAAAKDGTQEPAAPAAEPATPAEPAKQLTAEELLAQTLQKAEEQKKQEAAAAEEYKNYLGAVKKHYALPDSAAELFTPEQKEIIEEQLVKVHEGSRAATLEQMQRLGPVLVQQVVHNMRQAAAVETAFVQKYPQVAKAYQDPANQAKIAGAVEGAKQVIASMGPSVDFDTRLKIIGDTICTVLKIDRTPAATPAPTPAVPAPAPNAAVAAAQAAANRHMPTRALGGGASSAPTSPATPAPNPNDWASITDDILTNGIQLT